MEKANKYDAQKNTEIFVKEKWTVETTPEKMSDLFKFIGEANTV
jgi:hypothetical protein